MSEQAEIDLKARIARLSDGLGDDPPYRIHGVAIAPGDITKGKNGKKKWPAETLEQAAASLEGRPLVHDHVNSVFGNVGTITEARYAEGKGVIFEGELDNKDLAEKITNGRLEVSARIKHLPVEELERDEETDAVIIEPPAMFDNLSIVNRGASPSNFVDMGEAASLSEDDVIQAFELEEAENSEDVDPSESSESGSSDEQDAEANDEGEESSDQEESTDKQTETVSVDDPVWARKAELSRSDNEIEVELNMTRYNLNEDEVPEGVDASDPVLIDESELSDLEDEAKSADQEFKELKKQINRLGDIADEKEALEDEVEELREKANEVEEVKKMKAEELADAAGDVVEADDFMDLELATLRERVDTLDEVDEEEESEEAELEESDPEPQSEDVENEELEDDDDPADESEIAELKEQLEWYEGRGWESHAEEVREEIETLQSE